jgi:hypothetical protein
VPPRGAACSPLVAEESAKDARKVTVTLYHDCSRPSTLYVPIGRAGSD